MPLYKNDFLEQLSIQFQKLPGQEAQLKMSPFRVVDLKNGVPEKAKKSATMLLLYPKNGMVYSTLIQRGTYDGVHSKQISFPGGSTDKEDRNVEATAIREVFEEIGVDKIQVIGKLTDVYIEPSNFLVSPFVGFVNETPSFVLQKEEVVELIEYPISLLQEEYIVQKTTVETNLYGKLKVPIFNINEKKVWGATAGILSEFKEMLQSIMI